MSMLCSKMIMGVLNSMLDVEKNDSKNLDIICMFYGLHYPNYVVWTTAKKAFPIILDVTISQME